jgi:hypothetical protein
MGAFTRALCAAPVLVVLAAIAVGQYAHYLEHNPISPLQWNWDGKVYFGDAQSYHSPRTKEQLIALVKHTYEANGRRTHA